MLKVTIFKNMPVWNSRNLEVSDLTMVFGSATHVPALRFC